MSVSVVQSRTEHQHSNLWHFTRVSDLHLHLNQMHLCCSCGCFTAVRVCEAAAGHVSCWHNPEVAVQLKLAEIHILKAEWYTFIKNPNALFWAAWSKSVCDTGHHIMMLGSILVFLQSSYEFNSFQFVSFACSLKLCLHQHRMRLFFRYCSDCAVIKTDSVLAALLQREKLPSERGRCASQGQIQLHHPDLWHLQRAWVLLPSHGVYEQWLPGPVAPRGQQVQKHF